MLGAHPQPDLIFNYLGQFDQVVAGSSLFRFAPESPGPWHSPRARRRHALEVMTLVRDGRLEARFVFSEALHRAETIERLANASSTRFAGSSIIATRQTSPPLHARRTFLSRAWTRPAWSAWRGASRARGPVPALSDAASLLCHACDRVGRRPRGVAVRDPRCSRCRGLSAAPGSVCSSDTPSCARRSRLRRAASRCSSSRGTSTCPGARRICAGRPAEMQEAHIRALARAGARARVRSCEGAASPPDPRPARRRALRPSVDHAPPVHRRLVVADRVQGACGDLRRAARGRGPSLPEACSYGDYIRWLSREDGELRSLLEGRAGRSSRSRRPSISDYPTSANDGTRGRGFARSRRAETEILQSLARQQQVTLSSVVQAAWALLLSHYSDRTDVVFGAAFSGRPPELPGIDELDRAVREQRARACPHLARGAGRLARDAAPAEAARPEPAPVRPPRADPGLGRHPIAPASLRQPRRLPELRRRRVGSEATGDARLRLLVGPDATNYPITLVAFPGRT